MPKEFSRVNRVADLVQQELARLIQREVKDPRVGMITISEVKVSRDLGFADVYFTVLNSDDPAGAEQALGKAAGFLRSQLASKLTTRTTPKLRFHYDRTIDEGARVSRAITDAIESDKRHSGYDDRSDEGTKG